MRFTTDLKFQKCPKCSGVANTQGAPLTRSIFYLGDRFEVRCNNRECRAVLVFDKRTGSHYYAKPKQKAQ